MRLAVLAVLLLVCGCLGAETVVQREYVCPDGRVVDSPRSCNVGEKATTTTTVLTTSTTTTMEVIAREGPSSGNASSNASLTGCEGLLKNELASCLAIREANASMCPSAGLEYNWDVLSTSLFRSLGEDIVGEERQKQICDVFDSRRTCVMAVINKSASKKECSGSKFEDLCKEKFIVDGNDAAACEAYPQGTMQRGCYFALIRLRGNLDACIKYPDYQGCLARIAANTSDFSLCRQVYNARSRDDLIPGCINEARSVRCLSGNDSGADCCRDLPDNMRLECYDQKAKTTNDTVWCQRLVDWGRQDSDKECFTTIARRTSNPKVCEAIRSQDEHDYCIQEMVKATGDTTLCASIKDDAKRKRCTRGTM